MSAMEMPPLPLLVLDGLADDLESVGSLRDHGEVAPYGLALVDEHDVVDTLRSLLAVGLIQAWRLSEPPLKLVSCPMPLTMTQASGATGSGGRRRVSAVWREAHDVLDTYWHAHLPAADAATLPCRVVAKRRSCLDEHPS